MNEPTVRIINWRDEVLKAWGEQYNEPEAVYRFAEARGQVPREFRSTDSGVSGLYERP